MWYIPANDNQQPTHVDDERSGGSRAIPKNAKTSALQSLGEILNFIDCWLKHFQNNYQVILIIYHEAMINLFKHIPAMK